MVMATSQNRQRQKQQECGDQHRPGKQRHLVQGHARRAHVEDGGDEVDRTQDRRGASHVQRQDGEVHGGTGLSAGGKRRVNGPAPTGAVCACRAFDEHRQEQQDEGRRQKPERDVVHARERHVRRADHDRNHPVGKAADQAGMTMKKIMIRP
jgi:hypothetical protein